MSGPTRTPEDLMADIQRYLSLSVANSIPRAVVSPGRTLRERNHCEQPFESLIEPPSGGVDEQLNFEQVKPVSKQV